MKKKYPKYCRSFIDRHGTVRYYFHRSGKNVPLSGLPWSPQFMASYEQALNDGTVNTAKARSGSVHAAVIAFLQSDGFANGLANSTRNTRRNILTRFAKEHGDKPVGLMHQQALQNIINRQSPAVQRGFKKAMRGFIDYCLSHNLMKVDPLLSIKLAKIKSAGFHTWTEEEIAQYEERHAPGSKARLALELLLQTGAARCDMVRMGHQHVRAGKLSMRRTKTDVPFDIPLLPQLVAELELHPRDRLTFLVTEYGKPFTPAGFGGWFRDRCNEAGLKHCTAHGLRKSAAVRHAMNGATAPELMAWFGWTQIAEAQRYCEMANRIRLAESAGAKMKANKQ
jgi:site-specific recombinase XerD